MKTLKAILILAATVAIQTAQASDSPKSYHSPEAIKKSMTYPEFGRATNFQGFVAVEYSISSEGKITVIHMNYSDEALGHYVREKLENTVVENCEHVGTYYSKFKFRYIGS